MKQTFTCLEIKTEQPDVVLVILNRPQVANAFNTKMANELIDLFEGYSIDTQNLRCIILTGSGEKAFCAGADLKERKGISLEEWNKQHLIYERMVRAILACPIPIIAAVNGAAYGGGCEIACLADFIYAAENAKFALPEVSLGLIPGAGGTQTFARAVGERRAKEIILTAQPFSASQAMQWGMVNAVFPQSRLLEEAINTANKIAANAPIAVSQAKQSIHNGLQMSLSNALSFEIQAYNRTVLTEDRVEGIQAFNEKRKPKYKGR